MARLTIGRGRGIVAGALAFVWMVSGQSLLAAQGVAEDQSGEVSSSCEGCVGLTGYGDSAFAPAPRSTTPYGAWMIAVAVEVYDGTCASVTRKGKSSCLGAACESKVTYSWGSEVADAGLVVGYQQAAPLPAQESTWGWPDGEPWEKGKAGSITFDADSNPQLACGAETNFFIRGEACGGPFEAGCFGRCTSCVLLEY